MPAPRRRFLAIPHPDPPMRDVDPQRAARAVAQDAAGPVVRAEACDQLLHRDAVRGGLLLARRTSPRGLRRRERAAPAARSRPAACNEHRRRRSRPCRPARAGRRAPCRSRRRRRPRRTASPAPAPRAPSRAQARSSSAACAPLPGSRPGRIGPGRRSSAAAGRAACRPAYAAAPSVSTANTAT